jgi:hypothetical protein
MWAVFSCYIRDEDNNGLPFLSTCVHPSPSFCLSICRFSFLFRFMASDYLFVSSNFSNYQFCKQKCVTEIGLWMANLDCRLTYMYRKVWRWEKGIQNNGQRKMDIRTKIANQWSTKHSTKTPQNNGGEFRCSGRVGNFCSTYGIRRVTNPVWMR